MLVLAFDTSSSGFSIALLQDQKIIAQTAIEENGKQSELLVTEIEKLLRSQNIQYQNIDLIATNNGPGSFNGTRIGITCAKTLKLALNKPLIFVSSLEIIAFSSSSEEGEILIALEAGMNELFTAEFVKKDGELTQVFASKTIKIDELEKYSKNKILIRTNGEELTAKKLGLLALKKFHSGDFLEKQNTIYLREPNIGKRKK